MGELMEHRLKYDERPTWNETHEMAYERAMNPGSAPRIKLVKPPTMRVVRPEPRLEPFPLPTHVPQLMRIIELVAERTCVEPEQILGIRRCKSIAEARKLVYYLARRHTFPRMSYPEIGKAMKRHHSSVLCGEREIARLIERDESMRLDVERLRGMLARVGDVKRKRAYGGLRVAK